MKIIQKARKMRFAVFVLLSLLVFNSCLDEADFIKESSEKASDQVHFIAQLASGGMSKAGITESESITGKNKNMSIEIQESEWKSEAGTKTVWSDNGISSWFPDDAIGIYMRRSNNVPDPGIDRNNVKYTTTSSTSTGTFTTVEVPSVSYPYSITDKVDFYAYHPYSRVPSNYLDTVISIVKFVNPEELESTTLKYILTTNQSFALIRRNSDLLYASAKLKDNTSPTVNLSFNHVLTLLSFRVTSTDFAGIVLTKISLRGSKVTDRGSFDLKTGNISTGPLTYTPYITLNQTLSNSTPVTGDLVINPCTVNGTSAQMELVVMIGNITYECPVPANIFLPGRKYNITINVTNAKGGNVYITVGKGGRVIAEETVLIGEATGSFNNRTLPLPITVVADPGWMPYKAVFDGQRYDLLSTSPADYTIPIDSIKHQLEITFRPVNWYPVNDLLIHYDGIYSGGFEHSYTGHDDIDNVNGFDNNLWKDLSGNSNNGILAKFKHTETSGWNDGALRFDGSNDLVTYPGIMTGSYTMNFVINIGGEPQKQNARLNGEGPNYPTFYLSGSPNDNDRAIAVFSQPAGPIASGSQTGYVPQRNRIIQYTMTYDGVSKILKLYVNGSYYSQITITNPTPTNPATPFASLGGITANSARGLEADYHNFMLYSRVLTDTEIMNVYLLNKSRFGMP